MTDGGRRSHELSFKVLLVALVVSLFLAATGLATGENSVTARIALDHNRVHAGGFVHGTLILRNISSVPKVLLRGCGIDGRFGVSLHAENSGYFQGVMFSDVGCKSRPLIVANPGVTMYRFTIQARYGECISSAEHQHPTKSTPVCLRDSSGKRDLAPPLPQGTYLAVFFPDGKWLGPIVTSARLIVTNAH